MKQHILIFLLIIAFSCKIKNQSNFAVIKIEPSISGRFSNSTPSDLSADEVKLLEELIKKCISDYNSKLKKRFETDANYQGLKFSNYMIENMSKYKMQFVPIISKESEKIVWVNCFCNPGDWNWRTELLGVNDGGNCYFNLMINLNKKTCYDIRVNGYS